MANQITTAEFLTSELGVTDPTAATQGNMPIFYNGENVHCLLDVPGYNGTATLDPGNNKPIKSIIYNIIAMMMYPSLGGTTVLKFLDQTRSYSTPATFATQRTTPAGFIHNDTTGAPGSTIGAGQSRPWFYQIQNVATGEMLYGIHESLLTNQAGWETFIAAQVPNIYA